MQKVGITFWSFFGIFELQTVFASFLGPVVKKAKNIKLCGIYQSKSPSINFWVPKIRFSKIYIFKATIELAGLVMASS